jgi:hypothetical protein
VGVRLQGLEGPTGGREMEEPGKLPFGAGEGRGERTRAQEFTGETGMFVRGVGSGRMGHRMWIHSLWLPHWTLSWELHVSLPPGRGGLLTKGHQWWRQQATFAELGG